MGPLSDLLKKLGLQTKVPSEIIAKVRAERREESVPNKLATEPEFAQGKICVTEEYEKILQLIEGGQPIILVTGAAGTGKSYLIRWLRRKLAKQFMVIAPTGIAALNVGGQTIHSFCSLPAKDFFDAGDIKVQIDTELYVKLDLLIVDEISMVRCDLLDALDNFLRKNRSINDPFGGVQMLLLGDLFQIPPVPANGEKARRMHRQVGYRSRWFFDARVMQNSVVPIELTKIFRQEDRRFIGLLNDVRIAENIAPSLHSINTACLRPASDPVEITLTARNNAANAINARNLATLPGDCFTFQGIIQGRFHIKTETEKCRERLPAPYKLELKENARVMFRKNDEKKRWANGTFGIVHKVNQQAVWVRIDKTNDIHHVELASWDSYTYEYSREEGRIIAVKKGSYTQYPLSLAWATSIHKSQGLTFQSCRIDLGNGGAFECGQIYVALSRCKSLAGISLATALKASDVKCDPDVKEFHRRQFATD